MTGTFTGTVVEGWGVTAELLRREGIPVLGSPGWENC